MENKTKIKFLLIVGIFLIPYLFVLISYFLFDPFKVLYSYEDYYINSSVDHNRDFISTELYLKHKYQYDSFILEVQELYQ
jgi:hypothetical protein